jgi:chromosome segregation ATPase
MRATTPPTIDRILDYGSQLEQLEGELALTLRTIADVQDDMLTATRRLDAIEAAILAGVDGRNETERKAARMQALEGSAEFQAARDEVDRLRRRITDLEIDAEIIRRRCRRVELVMHALLASMSSEDR